MKYIKHNVKYNPILFEDRYLKKSSTITMVNLYLMQKWNIENNFEIFFTKYPAKTNLKCNYKEI